MDALGTLPPGIQAIASFIGLAFAAGLVYLAKNAVGSSPNDKSTPHIAVADLSAVQKITEAVHELHLEIEDGAKDRQRMMYELLNETKQVVARLDELNRNLRGR